MDCGIFKRTCTRRGTLLGVAAMGLLISTFWPTAVLAGKLSAVRSAVRPSSDDDHDHDHDHGRHHGHHGGHGHDDHDDGGGGWLSLCGCFWDTPGDYDEPVYVASQPYDLPVYSPSPAVGPPSATEDIVEPEMCFAEYPYAGGWDGYMVRPGDPWKKRGRAGRVWFEWGSDFDDLDRWSGALLFEGSSGWGLDTHWNAYTEDLGPAGEDRLRINDINVLYRWVETPESQIRVGAGLNWLSDTESNVGFNLTLKMDFYPIEPLIVSAEIDWGTLGAAEMFHASLTAGAMINRFEVFAGFDYRNIGGAELAGPFTGVRIWF